jgi:hypothetical protein
MKGVMEPIAQPSEAVDPIPQQPTFGACPSSMSEVGEFLGLCVRVEAAAAPAWGALALPPRSLGDKGQECHPAYLSGNVRIKCSWQRMPLT